MNATSATAEDLKIETVLAGGTDGKARRSGGDARRTIGWFIILSLVTWVWIQSAPSAFARGAPENLADLADGIVSIGEQPANRKQRVVQAGYVDQACKRRLDNERRGAVSGGPAGQVDRHGAAQRSSEENHAIPRFTTRLG